MIVHLSVILNPFSPPRWIPTRRNRQFNQAVRNLKQAVDDIITARRQRPGFFNSTWPQSRPLT